MSPQGTCIHAPFRRKNAGRAAKAQSDIVFFAKFFCFVRRKVL